MLFTCLYRYYSTSIFSRIGVESYVSTAIVGTLNFLTTILSIFLVDKVHKQNLIMYVTDKYLTSFLKTLPNQVVLLLCILALNILSPVYHVYQQSTKLLPQLSGWSQGTPVARQHWDVILHAVGSHSDYIVQSWSAGRRSRDGQTCWLHHCSVGLFLCLQLCL